MEKVVILARVSTDKQEYQRQITELTEHCRKMDWKVVILTNKQSFVELMQADAAASFGIVLGDCTDRRDAMATYVEAIESNGDKPIFSIIGNHDLFFSG